MDIFLNRKNFCMDAILFRGFSSRTRERNFSLLVILDTAVKNVEIYFSLVKMASSKPSVQ